ncbi:MAG: Gfo/Idh/MocA family protein [Kiritimatiellia bacterium]|jgi:predicted dehydrogenase
MAPISVGIIGMGGFAGSHQLAVKQLEATGACRLVCSCDPDLSKFKDKMSEWEYRRRGIKVFDNYLAMLDYCAAELDMVVIPTPVPLHAPMHRACIERGLAVYLEKPPTLNYQELDEMLEVEARAEKLTQVGFNHIVEGERRKMKQRLVAGEFGQLREVGYRGLWERSNNYYSRAPWAGRLMLNGRLVLDSGMGNAMAHYVHNILFWGGMRDVLDWAPVEWAEAELYRAHSIQGMDTSFVRAGLGGGVRLTIVMSHACWQPERMEWLVCDKARIFVKEEGYRIAWHDGRQETIPIPLAPDTPMTKLKENHCAYYAYLRGEAERPLTRLEDTRPFVQLCDLVYVAAGRIHQISPQYIQRKVQPEDQAEFLQIDDLSQATDCFIQNGEWPSQQGLPWAGPGGRAAISELPRLYETVERMVAEAGMVDA